MFCMRHVISRSHSSKQAVFDRYNIVNEADLKMVSEKLVSMLQREDTRAHLGHSDG